MAEIGPLTIPATAKLRPGDMVRVDGPGSWEIIDPSDISDGYHTFNELYRYRMLYHAAFVNVVSAVGPEVIDKVQTVKSWKHSDGEPCFGGGWFIVVTALPTGQISNHYEAQHWDLFNVPEVDLPPTYDGHTPAESADRLQRFLGGVPMLTCVHCGVEVSGQGDSWVHVTGLSRCQSPAVPYGHLAHPADVPCRADGPNPCLGASVDE